MKTALITGISRGIGEALAKKFLEEGYRVFGTSLSGKSTISDENFSVHQLDLASSESIKNCVEQIAKTGVKIDILINNAGVLLDEEETVVDLDKLRKTLEVNLIGTIDLTEQIIPLISEKGHVINLSSTAGSLGRADTSSHYPHHYPAYKISKTALNMYTKTLAIRLKSKDIIVSSVHPGWVRTDMGGEEADISPEESAQGIFNLAASRPATGQFWFNGDRLPW